MSLLALFACMASGFYVGYTVGFVRARHRQGELLAALGKVHAIEQQLLGKVRELELSADRLDIEAERLKTIVEEGELPDGKVSTRQ